MAGQCGLQDLAGVGSIPVETEVGRGAGEPGQMPVQVPRTVFGGVGQGFEQVVVVAPGGQHSGLGLQLRVLGTRVGIPGDASAGAVDGLARQAIEHDGADRHAEPRPGTAHREERPGRWRRSRCRGDGLPVRESAAWSGPWVRR